MGSTASVGEGPAIAVVGAGAVGCYFGGLLARAGAPVTLVGRPAQVGAITNEGLKLDTLGGHSVVRVRASTEISAARSARVVLVCVKTPDTEPAAIALAPHLGPDSVVLSLQNGVDNPERMHRATGIPAFAAAVYVAVHMAGPGHVKHTGRGDLVIGDPLAEAGVIERRSDALEMLRDCFARAGVPCRVTDDVRSALWTKLAMNCAYNAISALTAERYGVIGREPELRTMIERIIGETVAVAGKKGIALSQDDLLQSAWRLGDAMPDALSSTAQDLLEGKRTEIDSLNGYVAELGRRVGIATPVNDTLYALVKLAERVRA
ncbi:MAG: 2-dehydropantoate 2-reductase [Gemmatimonadetes bacterium]|nr:2-dehydropantoate 2-reductase [Gemmatimonadota bacterium]